MASTAPQPQAGSHAARRPILIFVPLILFAVLVALFLVRLFSGDASLLPSALVGKQVPAFALPPVEGLPDKQGFSDGDLRQGKVTLVNVFASWCVPCHQEHELIMRLSSDPALKSADVRLFGLAYKDDPANIKRFLDEGGARGESRSTGGSMACRKPLSSRVMARFPIALWGQSARRATWMSSYPRSKKRCAKHASIQTSR
jgi:thiol-disulfide isomerase/thioredoxin